MSPSRFADTGDALPDLATHFVVHCPKCNGKTLIDPYEESWRLTCMKCFHVEEEGHWYGTMMAYVSVKCRECNQPIRRQAMSSGEWKKLKVRCENCGDECEYEARLTKQFKQDGMMCDTKFGLPLWLQKTFREDLFWAFNYEHLTLLEDLVKAKHRERGITPRNTIRKNSSMASRLPTFITKAGNRDEVLKIINELQIKAI